ncbi:hypothetical protein QWZ06_25505 [Chryseobacterium tructae]|nr:hypothetical protein [Chryseobacterium tructae]MDN3695351.1 hypothetical protein [Chryseobacterium tructae]
MPFTKENPEEFEVPSDVVIEDVNFKKNNNLLGVQNSGTSSEKIISGDWQ